MIDLIKNFAVKWFFVIDFVLDLPDMRVGAVGCAGASSSLCRYLLPMLILESCRRLQSHCTVQLRCRIN